MLLYKIFNTYTKEIYRLVTFLNNTPNNEICTKLNEIKKQYKDTEHQLIGDSRKDNDTMRKLFHNS